MASIKNGLPTFYRELLQYFQEFKDKTNIFSYGKFLLWKYWFKKNILSVQDILNADGNFPTFQEFQDKFDKNKLPPLLPTHSSYSNRLEEKKARECEAPSHELLNTTTVSLFPGGSPVDLTDMSCKHYYTILKRKPQ